MIVLAIATFFPTFVRAENSCLPPFLALQVYENVSSQSSGFSYSLRTLKSNSWQQTRVLLTADPADQNGAMPLRVHFDPKFDGVSLPYNLYAILITHENEVVGWWDFTNGCNSPGMSFYPGDEVLLPAFKRLGNDVQKIQIMVWGMI